MATKKPIDDLIKQGAYRPSRHGDRLLSAGDPGPFPAEAPAWLSERAKVEWNRVVPLLLARQTLRPEDASMLGLYCAEFAAILDGYARGVGPQSSKLSAVSRLAGKLGLMPGDRAAILPAELASKRKRDTSDEGEIPWEAFIRPTHPAGPDTKGKA